MRRAFDYDLAQCSFPGKPNSELVHLKAPLQVIYRTNQNILRQTH